MMSTRPTTIVAFVMFALLAAPSLRAGDAPGFSEAPAVTRTDAGWSIRFEVDKSTDVEVAVMGPAGKIVRHLAAGALGGKNPPPPPLKAGLKQALIWDGKDDRGKAVDAARAARVRVRLGLGVKLGGFIGEDRDYVASFAGMATDAKGNLYVYAACTGNRGQLATGTRYLRMFSRKGKYLRTLVPMPADLPTAKADPFDPVPVPGGHLTPRNVEGTWPVFARAMLAAIPSRVGSDGVIHLFNWDTLAAVGPDGGAAGEKLARGIWAPKARPHQTIMRWLLDKTAFITISPDGRVAYVTGMWQKKPFQNQPIAFPRGRVYRIELDGGHLTKFMDLPLAAGAKAADAAGTAFDSEGRLLVCDTSGNRVVAVDVTKGEVVATLKVRSPRQVACRRDGKAVYVMSVSRTGFMKAHKSLGKFTGCGEGAREVWRKDLRKEGYEATFALDDSAPEPVIWVGVNRTATGYGWGIGVPAQIFRLVDAGGRVAVTDPGIRLDPAGAGGVTRLAVHPDTDTVIARAEYSEAAGYEGLTGKPLKLPFKYASDMGVGLDDNWYVTTSRGWAGWVCRYDRHLKPIDVKGLKIAPKARGPKRPANALGWAWGRWGQGFGSAGIAADPTGRVYSFQMINAIVSSTTAVVVYGPDGKPEPQKRMLDDPAMTGKHKHFNSVLVGPIVPICSGIALDYAGHIYIGVRVVPAGHKPTPGFEKDHAYRCVTGSVVKIAPEGGAVWNTGGPHKWKWKKPVRIKPGAKGLAVVTRHDWPKGTRFVENGLAIYPGLASMSGGFGHGCYCRQPMFGLDGWGRLYIPNAVTFSVSIVDNAGNEIATFGRYGNPDSAGPGSAVPVPAIPLGWPEAVGTSHKAVYVADVLNRRIVRLKKTWAAERTTALR